MVTYAIKLPFVVYGKKLDINMETNTKLVIFISLIYQTEAPTLNMSYFSE